MAERKTTQELHTQLLVHEKECGERWHTAFNHFEKLDDRRVIANIQENLYMQYFVGLKGFCSKV